MELKIIHVRSRDEYTNDEQELLKTGFVVSWLSMGGYLDECIRDTGGSQKRTDRMACS